MEWFEWFRFSPNWPKSVWIWERLSLCTFSFMLNCAMAHKRPSCLRRNPYYFASVSVFGCYACSIHIFLSSFNGRTTRIQFCVNWHHRPKSHLKYRLPAIISQWLEQQWNSNHTSPPCNVRARVCVWRIWCCLDHRIKYSLAQIMVAV